MGTVPCSLQSVCTNHLVVGNIEGTREAPGRPSDAPVGFGSGVLPTLEQLFNSAGKPAVPLAGPNVRIAVVRHGERMDQAHPKKWLSSPEAKRYPFDCPLTLHGKRQAAEVAEEFKRRSVHFDVVVSSPYARCIGTAVEICRTLGGLPLCIDAELGEIFSPVYFGEWEHTPPRRTPEEVGCLVPEDVRVIGTMEPTPRSVANTGLAAGGWIGHAPTWPEEVMDGRLRMAARVEQYASRAERLSGAGFLLVTHGDCVASCMALTRTGTEPKGRSVQKVEYCGWCLLERTFHAGEGVVGLADQRAGWNLHFHGVHAMDLGTVYDPSAEDCANWNAQQLAKMREEREQEHHSLRRRASTTIFASELVHNQCREVLVSQTAAPSDLKFSDLLPMFPPGRRLTQDTKLEEFVAPHT